MHQRYDDRRRERDETHPGQPQPRTSAGAGAVLELQRAIGNRGTAQVLARDKTKNRPQYEHSVKLAKFAPIEITGGNISDWAAKKTPDNLKVVSATGKHSAELKRLFDGKTRVDSMETNSVVGENGLVTITFKDCRITRYSAEGDKEEWTAECRRVDRQTLSIGSPRQ